MSKNLLIIGIFILLIPISYSNGGCIKVTDDILVQLSSSPLVPIVNKETSFLISFANNKKELINEEINGKVLIVNNKETILTKDFKVKDGILDLKHTFKKEGLYEIFLDFKIRNKAYMPEDFLIEVKEEKQNFVFNIVFLIVGIIIGIVTMKLIKNKMTKKYFLIFIMVILLSALVFAQQELPIGLQRLKQYEQQLASSITFLLAFFAGLISMTSPCGIAMLPTFFSVAFKDRKKAVLMTSAFSLGLLIAFTIFGLIAGLLGNFFNTYKLTFAVVSGFILILFGILLFFNIGFSIFNFKLDYRKNSFFSVALLGLFFGIGWTPCVGPILVGILVLAANAATLLNGVLMLLFYGVGIVTPLIVLAYFSDRYDWASSRLLRGKEITFNLFSKQIVTHTYNIIGGIFLLVIGILMVIFKGTFFFQTELPKYIPWSMSFWGYLNEKALESKIFLSTIGNVLGIIVVLLVIVFIVWYLKRTEKGDENENK